MKTSKKGILRDEQRFIEARYRLIKSSLGLD